MFGEDLVEVDGMEMLAIWFGKTITSEFRHLLSVGNLVHKQL